jgi:hypothetical protein
MIMISLPMSKDGWQKKYAQVEKRLKDEGYDVVPLHYNEIDKADHDFKYKINVLPLMYLGNSLIRMSMCDAVYFCDGWENARGCRIEHQAAKHYDLKLLYESEDRTFKEVRVLIIRSGKQYNYFTITKDAVLNMSKDDNAGIPLMDYTNGGGGRACGYLTRTELVEAEDGELELYGYFESMKDRSKCYYQLQYDADDNTALDNNSVLHKCTLSCCSLIEEDETNGIN